ncbi:MAG: aminomethyl-transferring glycine dehydrogenase subunit GcvPB [Opitutales bacterium]|nr:aminomethyl-transferring glycine dehydrogenase subunit GcvPB [Opitutales bacterium]
MSLKNLKNPLPYNPDQLSRERTRHYIPADDSDIKSMLEATGAKDLKDLYSHIPDNCRFIEQPDLPDELEYDALLEHLETISEKNRIRASFIGDGLPDYEVHPIVPHVASIRNLTTAYTPYQPERSQGTLMTHWLYQCVMSQLTGFEAINSSLYDRASAIFEAICTAIRISRKATVALVAENIYPGDLEVIRTLSEDTEIEIATCPVDPETGLLDLNALKIRIGDLGNQLAAVVFPQVNNLGLLEDVDAITDLIADSPAQSVAVVDPMLLSTGGLKPPTAFGQKGADMLVGEAQHLAIGPNFGGPGLGLFGVRHNEESKNAIRQTPGRYVGKAQDLEGRNCLVMVLSTREQHIRKDKATSNICSNQAFLATLAGAAVLARGEDGMAAAILAGREKAKAAVERLTALPGIALAFPASPFFNEVVFEIEEPVVNWISKGCEDGLHIGVDVSDRIRGKRNLLKVSFSDREADLDRLITFFARCNFTGTAANHTAQALPANRTRATPVGLPNLGQETIAAYYDKLGSLNVSPDDGCYPLGSCTMKYNPYVNDWAANLPGFTDVHPQAPIDSAQGCLEILYEIQEWFKKITGLPGVTTQPVAGAQGELVGIKLFQAYHRQRGEGHRNVVLIPDSAHGTNFATAVMAGYKSGKDRANPSGIVLLKSGDDGTIDYKDLCERLDQLGDRVAGIMITNPNTCGIFEKEFRKVADKVHEAGGLVYMDGANMNAIAGWCDLGRMGVDAVHNNLHKTWTIPHGGGGPGDAIVAVSEKLIPFLPGHLIEKDAEGRFSPVKPEQSIGSFHRHWGNFAHKVRAYAYLARLGKEGVPRMTAMAVLSARYCYEKLKPVYPTLPSKARNTPRMHEFILTIEDEDFERIEKAGIPKALAITRIGKLFLDFGFHAPTVAWPEAYGLMIEPTESYTQSELDRFCEAVSAIRRMIKEHPEVLNKVPLFTPVDRIDDVSANRQLQLFENVDSLPEVYANRLSPSEIHQLSVDEIYLRIVEAAKD